MLLLTIIYIVDLLNVDSTELRIRLNNVFCDLVVCRPLQFFGLFETPIGYREHQSPLIFRVYESNEF